MVAMLLLAGCDRGAAVDSGGLAGQGAGQKQLSGAIFTTGVDGTRVDQNIYEEHCDVYLNGGPEKEGAAGLPAGDYYFQVTDPAGGEAAVLLSNDDISARQVSVDETGRFTGVSGDGDHMTSANAVDGGVAVQLCPFLPTPNPGCEFKVWLTPVEDYDPTAAAAVFGFLPSRSKTDNFKVCEDVPEEQICGNGITEGDEECDDGNDVEDDACSNHCTENSQ